jgi:hypothetical protein
MSLEFNEVFCLNTFPEKLEPDLFQPI